MLEFSNSNMVKLENYLKDNGYMLNSNDIPVFHNPTCYYYKNSIAVLFQRNNDITIKDYENNRKFQFQSTSSSEIIINFLKYLQKDLILA